MSMRNSQSGNAIFIVLIGIALFAALSYAVSKSMRNSGNFGGSEKLNLQIDEMLTFGNAVSTAVAGLLANGCKDTEISFDGNNNTSYKVSGAAYGYVNSSSPTDNSCNVFDKNGGGVAPKILPAELTQDPSSFAPNNMHPRSWLVIPSRVIGVGSDSTAVDGTDLIMYLGNVSKSNCIAINKKLNITNPSGNPPSDTNSWGLGATFTGGYIGITNPIGDGASSVVGKRAFCISEGSTAYGLIQVLIAR